jgi:hypothetical protein
LVHGASTLHHNLAMHAGSHFSPTPAPT